MTLKSKLFLSTSSEVSLDVISLLNLSSQQTRRTNSPSQWYFVSREPTLTLLRTSYLVKNRSLVSITTRISTAQPSKSAESSKNEKFTPYEATAYLINRQIEIMKEN